MLSWFYRWNRSNWNSTDLALCEKYIYDDIWTQHITRLFLVSLLSILSHMLLNMERSGQGIALVTVHIRFRARRLAFLTFRVLTSAAMSTTSSMTWSSVSKKTFDGIYLLGWNPTTCTLLPLRHTEEKERLVRETGLRPFPGYVRPTIYGCRAGTIVNKYWIHKETYEGHPGEKCGFFHRAIEMIAVLPMLCA